MNISKATHTHFKDKELKAIIEEAMAKPELCKDEDLIIGLKAIINDFASREYRITVIGEFSSGKSTFLNAIIGQDILPHGVEETTAAVTYIHNVPKTDKNYNKVIIYFRNGNNPINLDLSSSRNALIDYVTAKSKDKDVVKEIAEVHLFLNFIEGGEKLVLIDTPGLNGIKDGMRDITYREIMRSHANICLFHIKGISQTDVDFIEHFYKDGTPFFFVLNQIDRLTEETPEEKIKDFKKDIKNNILHISQDPKFVFGVSALQALSARDKTITRVYSDDKKDLTEEARRILLDKSGMKDFESSLLDFIKNGEMERNYLEQVKSRIRNLFEITRDRAIHEKNILQAKVSDIPEKNILESQRKKVLDSINRNLGIIKTKLGSQMSDLEKKQRNYIIKACDKISEEAHQIVNNWNTLEEAELQLKRGTVVNTINNKVNFERNKIEIKLTPEFDLIFDNLISVVRSFVPNVKYSKKESKWNFTVERETVQDQSKIQMLKNEIREISGQIDKQKKKKEKQEQDLNNLNDEIKSSKKDLTKLEEEKRRELRNLGYRPSYRCWQEQRTVKKRFLFIPYNGTESYTKDNSSEIAAYDNKKSRINQQYDSKIAAYRRMIIELERKKDKLDPTIFDSQISKLKKTLTICESQMKHEEEELELQRKYARTKLLNNLKNKTREFISKSITPMNGELFLSLSEDIRNNIRNAEQKMHKILETEYSNLRSEFLKNLENLIKKLENKEDIKLNKEKISQLEKKITLVGKYLINI